MLHLLKIEWLKVKNYRTFWILLGLLVISVPALNYMTFDISNNAFPKNAKKMQQMIMGQPFSFPLIWQTTSWLSSLILFIPSLLIITLTTNEFTYKTHRQNIIDGLSRSQFITVKLAEVFMLAIFCTALVFCSTLWIGHLAAVPGEEIHQFANIKQLGYFFIEAVSYIMVSFLLSITMKRAGLVVGVFFLYSMILEEVLVKLLKTYAHDIGRFLPLETTDQLLPNPFLAVFRKPEDTAAWSNMLPYVLAGSAVYFLLYCVFSLWYFRTKDL